MLISDWYQAEISVLHWNFKTFYWDSPIHTLYFRSSVRSVARRRGQRWSDKKLNITLEIEFVTAVSGAQDGTLVNISLPVLVVATPWSTNQEPAEKKKMRINLCIRMVQIPLVPLRQVREVKCCTLGATASSLITFFSLKIAPKDSSAAPFTS